MFVPRALSKDLQDSVRALLAEGLSDNAISRRTGVGRATVTRWRRRGLPRERAARAGFPRDWRPSDRTAYSYLLGIYLGDGTVTRHGQTFGLHVYIDGEYPQIVDECEVAIRTVSGVTPSRYLRPHSARVRLTSYRPIWPAAFPQSGPGRKHERSIELVGWQREIVDEFPEPFIRGLIHSDGSRCLNTFDIELMDGPRTYSYPRYFFTNYSADIRAIFCDACDRIGIRWSRSSWRNISVSHRRSVALLDSFVGPKS